MPRKKKQDEIPEEEKFKNEKETADDTSSDEEKEDEVKGYGKEEYPGRVGIIDEEATHRAMSIFTKYREAKSTTDERVVNNETWFNNRCTNKFQGERGKRYDANSAYLFNSIINKHADFMDNTPTVNILPREQSDQKAAEELSKIVPLIMEKADFPARYNDGCWDKLIGGGAIYKPFWNNNLGNGLGDIDIQNIDVLSLFWEPGCKNIQDSANIFHVEYESNDSIIDEYPFMKGLLQSSGDNEIREYIVENQNSHDGQSLVFDWYYKKRVNGRDIVHFCRFCNGKVLWASENIDEMKDSGYYDHGKYPFIIDTMFPLKGTPFGFGYVDIMKAPQTYIDRLDEIILRNSFMAGKPRFFKRTNTSVNIEQFADWDKDFVDVEGSQMDDGNLKQITINPIPAYIINHQQNKINELKETSGNRDFSQGATTSGITSGTAIAALQEAGSKLSRDMINTSYRAYQEIVNLVVELVRQFYTEERCFRIDQPNGQPAFTSFDNRDIREQKVESIGVDEQGGLFNEISVRRPVFDFKISAQKQSPFNRTAQNETAKELYQLGIFNPQMADQAMGMLEMMEFEGIEQVRAKVGQNGQLYQQLLQMSQLAMQMAAALDETTGGLSQMTQQVMAIANSGNAGTAEVSPIGGAVQSKLTGADGMPATDNTQATKARINAAKRSEPR